MKKVKLGHEIATVLRKNVVQAHKVQGVQTEDNKEIWRMCQLFQKYQIAKTRCLIPGIQLTKDTEMGDNTSIKTQQPCESSSRRARKQEKAAAKWVFCSSGLAKGVF
jgi:hypothetical protein